ncbi:MAG: hypothetical protein LUF85_02825 [Bacteroides sp.]|nr:hypothetical protein [Bacteroides sp.]
MHETGPFSIPSIRDFVPKRIRPWLVLAFVIVFQLSGGIYLAAVSEMAGSLALMQEDILMAGYASLVGLGLTFTIMFRLKFRFASKTTFLVCGAGLILCNFICMYTHSVPVMVATCFVAGIFRMWATFECNSTLQLWITPKRDLSVFFCYIYLLVQGCIQFSGMLTIYTAAFANWAYMHWLVIGLLGTVMLITVWTFRSYRSMRKLPLLGIDWLGGLMWGLTILCIIFVCIYGDHYDWYESVYIRIATVMAIVLVLLNLWRASFIRHPYIALQTWTFRPVYLTLGIYLVVDLLLAPSHLLEHIYMEGILGFDDLHVISLNWVVLAAILAGSAFTYFTFARRKWTYKTLTVIGFAAITAHLVWFYFYIDYNLPKEALWIPLFLRTFGYILIGITFLTALSLVPFQHFFEALSVQSFVSAGFGGVLGTAILAHLLKTTLGKNTILLGAGLDRVNTLAGHLHPGQLYGTVQQQALIVSMKEIYGWLALTGLFCMLLFLIRESDLRPRRAIHPRYRLIRRYIKHELRMRKNRKEQRVYIG